MQRPRLAQYDDGATCYDGHIGYKQITTNTAIDIEVENGDKVVTRMTFHSLDNSEDEKPLVDALFYSNLLHTDIYVSSFKNIVNN